MKFDLGDNISVIIIVGFVCFCLYLMTWVIVTLISMPLGTILLMAVSFLIGCLVTNEARDKRERSK